MQAVAVDLQDDRFDVTFDASQVTSAMLLDTVRQCGFEPEVVVAALSPVAASSKVLDLNVLPAELRKLFVDASKAGRLVLLRFSGPG